MLNITSGFRHGQFSGLDFCWTECTRFLSMKFAKCCCCSSLYFIFILEDGSCEGCRGWALAILKEDWMGSMFRRACMKTISVIASKLIFLMTDISSSGWDVSGNWLSVRSSTWSTCWSLSHVINVIYIIRCVICSITITFHLVAGCGHCFALFRPWPS